MGTENRHATGQSRLRREDRRLLKGEARYTDNLSKPDMVHAAVCRSWHGNATITDIDTSAAEDLDGVVAVYTAADLEGPDMGVLDVTGVAADDRSTPFPMLAKEQVRYAGEAIAVVVADHRYVAHDATDLIDVQYEVRDAVTSRQAALADDAPVVHDAFDDNLAFENEFGDAPAVDDAFDAADHIVRLDIENNRVLPNALEPRAALAEYDETSRKVTVHMSTQVPHGARSNFSNMFDLPEEQIRVIAPDVGGGFGSKGGSPYAGEPLAVWCAIELGRPVKWVATRSEAHRTDHHGRDIFTHGEIAVDADGTIRGLRLDSHINMGAYALWSPFGNLSFLSSGPYAIPAIHGRVRGIFTNTAPVAPYRGAGRPEIIHAVERLVEEAGAAVGIDPVEFRRQNFIPPHAFPYETATGAVFDSGNYENALDEAVSIIDYDAVRDRQQTLLDDGRYLGIGIASFVENTGTAPSVPETARVELDSSGITAFCGTADHGQGHATVFAQLLSDELGIPDEDIEIHEGDSDDLPHGVGTFGSRSAPVGGSALIESAREVREEARRVAANRLEASVEDIEFEEGSFFVTGAPDRSITIRQVVELVETADDLPSDVEAEFEATVTYDPPNHATAFGTHAAIVEVDPRSGELEIERYVAVDDCGVQLNPLIVEGQIHGGVAQGLGQALYEHAVYDEHGTLLTGTLQDYAMPRSTNLPELETGASVTPCPHNPSGAKGVGEGGSIGAPPAIVNAVVDALRPFGVTHIDMPLTEETIWNAIGDAAGEA